MSTAFSLKKIELLPDHLKSEVNDFVEFLLEKEKLKTKKNNNILKFAGIISEEESIIWKKNIEENCNNIDYDGWK